MKLLADQFYEFLDRPIRKPARVVLALLVIPLLLSFSAPLWNIHLEAAQYPKGLDLDVYSYKLEGGHEGKDIKEINTLNHYIGMAKIEPEMFIDLSWLPFAIGLLVILSLRTAAIGNVRMLIDQAVIATYVSLFGFARFYIMMYRYGHELDPDAPFKIKPFTPVLFGTKQVANFTTSSYPQLGSYYVGVFVVGMFAVLIWHLVSGRKDATRKLGLSGSSRAPRDPAAAAKSAPAGSAQADGLV